MSMKKKNIEKLFREKLQDYGQLPEEHLWDRISGSLDEKKAKRRILPIWWRLGGVAALLIIGFYLFSPEKESSSIPEIISDVEGGAEEPIRSGADGLLSNPEGEEIGVAVSESDSENSPLEEGSIDRSEKQPDEPGTGKEKREIIALSEKRNREKEMVPAAREKNLSHETTQGKIADANVVSSEITGYPSEENNGAVTASNEKDKREIAQNRLEEKKEDLNVQEQSEETAKAALLEGLAQQEEETEEGYTARRWEVGPRVAPVIFSSLAQGSPIHSSFRDNAKSGNVNMSYGVAVTYEIAKKVKLRSGLHRVDFGYDTQDVSFTSSPAANTTGTIDNINYTLSSRNLVVRSNSPSGKVPTESAQDVAGPDPSLNGIMVQEFGYLEVPLELSYEVFDRKLGLNLVGGVSSLFLLNNSVVLQADGNTTEMGEANNINELNFSTNFGVGLSYRLFDKIQVNLEPMFKYQLNTFSDTSGNFQPFSMGIYSGLNFRF